MRTMIPLTCISLAALALVGCSGEDVLHICIHAVDSTAELNDAVDNGDPCVPPPGEGGGELAEGVLADDVCEPSGDQRVAAVSPDGEQVAYLTCNGSSVGVAVQALSGGERVELGESVEGASVEFTLDSGFVIFGADGELSVAAADGSGTINRLSEGTVESYRLFQETVGQGGARDFEPRLLVQDEVGGQRRLFALSPDSDYAEPNVILEDGADGFPGTIIGGLQHLSDSGRTLVSVVDIDGEEKYFKLRTNAEDAPLEMSFGPNSFEMAGSGLGDTHNFAFAGDRLVRIMLETRVDAPGDGDIVELAADGLLEDHSQIIDRQDMPGIKYAHFIQNGNLMRRKREADEPLQQIAAANAIGQGITPDTQQIVYLSDDAVYSVSAVGDGEPVELIEDTGGVMRFRYVIAADSSEIAVLARGSRLWRSPVTESGAAVLLDVDQVAEASLGYNTPRNSDADESRLIWLSGTEETRDRLQSAAVGAEAPTTLVESDVRAWVAIPDSGDILYIQGTELHRATP
jgi:hypothetical protein